MRILRALLGATILLVLNSAAHAQTFGQLQLGINRGATPSPFGVMNGAALLSQVGSLNISTGEILQIGPIISSGNISGTVANAATALSSAGGGTLFTPNGNISRTCYTPTNVVVWQFGPHVPTNQAAECTEGNTFANSVVSGTLAQNHIGSYLTLHHVQMIANGSGGSIATNGTADFSLNLSALKKNWTIAASALEGEIDPINCSTRNGGLIGPSAINDASCLLYNVGGLNGSGYHVGIEGQTIEFDTGTLLPVHTIGIAIGISSGRDHSYIGYLASANLGVSDTAFYATDGASGSFSNLMKNIVYCAAVPYTNFVIRTSDAAQIFTPCGFPSGTTAWVNSGGTQTLFNNSNASMLAVAQNGAAAFGVPTSGVPASTGVINTTGYQVNGAALAFSNIAGQITLAQEPTLATNTILGNATSGSAVPTALTIGTCSAASSALTWTTNTGFGCNTLVAGVANPTASVGLAAVNGTANTALRSDGAPALSQSIVPTWTGIHTFSAAPVFSLGAKYSGSSSGTVTVVASATAGTPTITWGNTSGTPAVTASAPLALSTTTGNLTVTGAAGQVLAGSTPAFTATPTLGVAGSTVGSLAFANATSGSITLQSVTGALGSAVLSLPAATDTLVGKATTDALTNKDVTSGTNTFPTFNQNTTGSAAKWTTARNLAGNSVDGSANVAFSNKFIVQGTTDAGLSGAQFLGALGTGLMKNTTTTGVVSIVTEGTGVETALGVNVGTAGAFVVNGGALGTPSSGTLTSATGLPISSGVSGLGTGIATALAVNTGSAGAPVLFNGAAGTPTSLVLTNATGYEQDGAWVSYTPTIACATGGSTTITSVAGAYKMIGTKTVMMRAKVVLNVNSACLTLTITLPFAPVADLSVVGRETVATGKSFTASVAAGATAASLFYYDNTNVAANNATFPFLAGYDIP